MSKGRNTRYLVASLMIIAVIGMSVAFASLQQLLIVNGGVRMKGGSWGVGFQNLQNPVLGGNAKVDTPASLNESSTIMNFAASLNKPGDSITYVFDVKNFGTIDAKVNSIELLGLSAANSANVTYTLTYFDNTPILVGDTLDAGTFRTLKLKVLFNENAPVVKDEDIPLSLGASITYLQQ